MHVVFLKDSYKAGHRPQYPDNTTLVYSNFTARKSRVEGADGMVFFGLQAALKKLIEQFTTHDRHAVVREYKQLMSEHLGYDFDAEHINALISETERHGLPIKVKALPEGTLVPFQTPCFTLYNTKPEFFWLTNFLETYLSAQIWKPCTSATTARRFRKLFSDYAALTGADQGFVDFQGHDFSMRGMSCVEDAANSGMAHLLYFKGTDTIPAILNAKKYYGANTCGFSVNATEHSVMCAGGEFEEQATFNRLLDIYPEGILSIVSDTWDLWAVLTEILPSVKDRILARNGKVVVRPDSGVPNLILNGDPDGKAEVEKKGALRLLHEEFGGNPNKAGFREIDPHVGLIYGDGINFSMGEEILYGMAANGFSSSNTVLGLGSYTYQYVTRDTYGTVCKATYCEVNGEPRPIFKKPKTGAWKTSHKGLLRVNEDLSVSQDVTWEEEGQGLLRTVFEDGKLVVDEDFETVRARALSYV